jgi:hypothetical protein
VYECSSPYSKRMSLIMKSDSQKMGCGNCGGESFGIYINDNGDLTAECNTCNSTTKITVRSKIHLDWGEESDGILAKL